MSTTQQNELNHDCFLALETSSRVEIRSQKGSIVTFAESTVRPERRIPKPPPRYLHSADHRTCYAEEPGLSGPFYRKPDASTMDSIESSDCSETTPKAEDVDIRRPLLIGPLCIQPRRSQRVKICTVNMEEVEVVRRLHPHAYKTYLQVTSHRDQC